MVFSINKYAGSNPVHTHMYTHTYSSKDRFWNASQEVAKEMRVCTRVFIQVCLYFCARHLNLNANKGVRLRLFEKILFLRFQVYLLKNLRLNIFVQIQNHLFKLLNNENYCSSNE